MNAPLLNFSLIWRGTKCPRQLKVWFDTATLRDPKQCSPHALAEAALQLNRHFYPDNPAQADIEVLDSYFQAWQEDAVRHLAASLFPQAREPDADSIWNLEGETLREVGWIQSMDPKATRGIDLTIDNWANQLATMSAVKNAGLLHHFIFAKADYLFRDEQGSWLLLLVKSGVRVKDSYIAEAELIKWVYAQKGVSISRVYLLSPNDGYELPSPQDVDLPPRIDPRDFFCLHSLNSAIKHMTNPLSAILPAVLTSAVEDIACNNSRTCPMCRQTAPELPRHNIYTLHRGGRAVELLEAQGIKDLADMHLASEAVRAELKDRHHIQLKTIRTGQPHVDKPNLQAFLSSLRFPICFLDFESTCQVLPPLIATRPWEHLPFMFSVHRAPSRASLGRPADMESRMTIMDPQRSRQSQLIDFANNLIDACQDCGSVLVYGAALESITFTRLARTLPEKAPAFISLRDRIIDLQIPFAQFWYYHPQQYGKLSLKKILPLMSDHNHDQLDLQSGGEANLNYYFLSNPEAVQREFAQRFAPVTIPQWMENFSRYCGLDTLGLAHILDTFYRLAE